MRRLGGRWLAGLAAVGLLVLGLDAAVVLRRWDPGGGGLPDAATSATQPVDEQLAEVARLVADVRELDFRELPRLTYLEPAALSRRVAGLLEDYSDAEADVDRRVLVALGAAPPGSDLEGMLGDALAERVAGFYDAEAGELVVGVRTRGSSLSPLEEVVLAHELQHALADQTLGLPEGQDEPGGEDAALAERALVEGDATVTMQEYAQRALSVAEQLRLAAEGLAVGAGVETGQALPHFVERSLLFPYREGAAFVSALRERGGWGAVDDAYRHLPVSTAQIIFPTRYPDDAPRPVTPSGELAPPWQRSERLAVGAADLLFLFEAPGGDPARALDDPRGAVAGWDGGALRLWTRQGDSALSVVISRRGDDRLCGAVVAWYRAVFEDDEAAPRRRGERLAQRGDRQAAVVGCSAEKVRVGIGPDLETARALLGV